MSSVNSSDSRSSVSHGTLTEEFGCILAEERMTFENVGPFDWDIVEEFLKDKLSPSPALPTVTSVPPEITEPQVNRDLCMSLWNHGDVQSSVKEPVGEFEWFLADKKELSECLAPSDWEMVEDPLKGKISTPPPAIMPAPPQIASYQNDSHVRMRFLEEFNFTLREELKNKVPTKSQKVEDLLRPPSPHVPPPNVISLSPQFKMDKNVVSHNEDRSSIFWPAPLTLAAQAPSNPLRPSVIIGPSQSRVGINSLKEPDSRASVFIKEVIEDVECLPPEKRAKYGNVAPTGFMIEEFPLEGVNLSPPPSPTHSSPPLLLERPYFLKCSTSNRQGGVQGPPPRFTPGAPSLVLPGMPQPNSNLPTGAAHSQGEILQSLPISNLPRNTVLQPFCVVNGQVLYSIVSPPPLPNASSSNSNRKRKNGLDDARPYVKKPPNAFMLFLREQRPRVLNMNNSEAVNSILGERWNCLPEDQKAKYYELTREERQQHEQQHPEWSNNKGKKRKRARQNTSETSSRAYTPKGLLHFPA